MGTPDARTDVLVVSLGTTSGWRAAASELASAIGRAGANVAMVTARPVPRVRTFALTDLAEALSVRQAAAGAVAAHQPAAIVYCSITAALLWPVPGAIWLDSTACGVLFVPSAADSNLALPSAALDSRRMPFALRTIWMQMKFASLSTASAMPYFITTAIRER